MKLQRSTIAAFAGGENVPCTFAQGTQGRRGERGHPGGVGERVSAVYISVLHL